MNKAQGIFLAAIAALLVLCCVGKVFACGPMLASCEGDKVSKSHVLKHQEQTIVLSVPTMNCATCPITVKAALKKVTGVNEVNVSFKTKSARVTFDSSKTNTSELTVATKNAGYPSSVVSNNLKKK